MGGGGWVVEGGVGGRGGEAGGLMAGWGVWWFGESGKELGNTKGKTPQQGNPVYPNRIYGQGCGSLGFATNLEMFRMHCCWIPPLLPHAVCSLLVLV